jgi:hypothetical protein
MVLGSSVMSQEHASPAGSEWHRWEPHIHAPGTLLADRYTVQWDAYLKLIEDAEPRIEALGITDYYCLHSYKKALKAKREGRLPRVKLLFPNIEFRLTIETAKRKGINLHLLLSPADPDHVEQIERILLSLGWEYGDTVYRCRVEDFARLGRAVDPLKKDEAAAIETGANQFKVSFEDLRTLFRKERWLQDNCLIAVAGAEHDGTAGLQADASFAATRQEIERFAHIIFSGNPQTRDFWLGRRVGTAREEIEAKYRFLKPCMQGSDAHREDQIGKPDLDRLCWVKADLTFEGLRQAVIEPSERVYVGAEPPGAPAAFNRLRSVAVKGAPWFRPERLPLNSGLIAVIGARGSGKTALADVIACGARGLASESKESFVHRASDPVELLKGATVELEWSDGKVSAEPIREPDPWDGEGEPPGIRYLSQQFVERLCSQDGLATELVEEIERVVFEATDETDRYGATTFAELRKTRLEPIGVQREAYSAAIDEASQLIADEDALKDSVQSEQKRLEALNQSITAANKELDALIPKGNEEPAERLAEVDAACGNAEAVIQKLRVQKQKLDELGAEVSRVTASEPQRLSTMRRRYEAAGIPPTTGLGSRCSSRAMWMR